MTAVTLVKQHQSHVPGQEVVIVTATDGYTYTAQTLSNVDGGHCTLVEASSLNPNIQLTISNNVVTIVCTGLSSKKCCLTLYGN